MCKPEMERQKSSFCRIHRSISHFPSAQSIFFRCDNLVEIVGWTILTRRGERRVMQNFHILHLVFHFLKNIGQSDRKTEKASDAKLFKFCKTTKAAKSLRNMRSRAKGQRAVGRKLSKVSQAPGQTSLCPEEKNVKRKF